MLLVVGGQSRNVGKTSLAAQIISRFRHYDWTAVKVTQHGHVEPGRPYVLGEEREPGASDSGRYLRAGARRSFWLRTPPGRLADAVPALRDILAAGAHTLVESNSILEFFDPDLYLVVLDFACEDFKPSTLRYLHRADALVVIDRGGEIPPGPWKGKKRFLVRPPDYVTAGLSEFVAERLSALA
jgi:hypothetical protein